MTPEELKALSVDKSVDARGTSCPGPLLAAKRGMPQVPVDGIMQVLSSDEGTKKDIPLWCKKIGHDYLGDYEADGDFYIYVRRKK
jgi:tRNA 2-thiouridine synthesizing protein A